MATQALIVQPPYTYSRNPMALGAIGMYLGVALLFHSLGSLIVVTDLRRRPSDLHQARQRNRRWRATFGQEYLAYKQRTPFLVPRIRNRK